MPCFARVDDSAEDVTAATLRARRLVAMLADALKLRPERGLLLRRRMRRGASGQTQNLRI